MTIKNTSSDLRVLTSVSDRGRDMLAQEALDFLFALHDRFDDRRRDLLAVRKERQKEIDQGARLDFLSSTGSIRQSDWRVSPVPDDIRDRRVEITGPVDRKMVINGLNSGAKVFMADFEDANAPTWHNNVEGQVNLYDAVRRTITYTSPQGKSYRLGDTVAVLFVRPRGWHLNEKHVRIGQREMSASLFDFGLYFFHNAKVLLERGSGPYFYLPKLESHLEARLWNEVFVFAQEYIGIPVGSIKATVLIETLPAAFEMEEILYELRTHSAGLNCGRWDYIFSYIKKFRRDRNCVLPDRAQVTMATPFMKAYSEYTIKICHKRGAFAMGGMAAQIPIKDDAEANRNAMEKVAQDKEREAKAGHDGTWVAHPGLIPIAMEIFDRHMPTPNQLSRQRDDVVVTAQDLVSAPQGDITADGVKLNIDVSLQYLASWLRGSGCVPIYNLMEDAATAEISRAQLWQWVRHQAQTKDGTRIDSEYVKEVLQNTLKALKEQTPQAEKELSQAAEILSALAFSDEMEDFLTLPAYAYLD